MDRLMDKHQVSELLEISVNSMPYMLRRGLLPQPMKLSPGPCGRLRWRASDIEAYIRNGGVAEPAPASA